MTASKQTGSPIPPGVPPVARRAETPDTIAPDGSEIRLLAGTPQAATRASLCEVTLPPGQVSRPVWHQTVEEIWYVLEGAGDVWRCPPPAGTGASGITAATGSAGAPPAPLPDVAPVRVSPGDALVIPTNWRFQFRASSAGPLRFLCYTSPPWPGPDEAQSDETGGLGPPTV